MTVQKHRSTVLLLIGLLVTGSAIAQGPRAEQTGLQVTIGGGMLASPTYLGDDDYQAMAFPNISFRYGKRFSASLRGIEYVALLSNGWKAGPVLTYDRGRKAAPDSSPLMISGKPSTDLVGLDDIDATFQLGGFVEYQTQTFAAKLKLDKGLDGGHEGIKAEASISFRKMLKIKGPPIFMSVGPAVALGDDTYNGALFDVTAAQATTTGISEYDAGAGINAVGIHASAFMPTSKKTSVIGILKYDLLTGDVAGSSIVKEKGSKNQVSGGLFFNYKF